ncbi:MAG: response regulator, partial [Methanospirillum sp.]|uniref:ATP-binding response regulator n=1 Tax=Methanospirillum sp. TaxID=45200 RepID=UPI0023734E55
TGVSDVHTAVQAIKSGACDYIIKDVSREYLTTLPDHLETIIKARIDTAREQLIGSMCRYSTDTSPVGVFIRDFLTGEPLFFNSRFASRFGLPPYREFVKASLDYAGIWDTLCLKYGIPVDQINQARHEAGEIIRHDISLPDGHNIPLYSTITGSDGNRVIRQFLFFFDTINESLSGNRQNTESTDSLSVLAGGIAHEMNNIFTSILCDVSLARELAPYESDLKNTCFDHAEKAIQYGKDVASRLLTYADGGHPLKTVISLQDLLADLLPLHHQKDASIIMEIPDDIALLEVDPDLMRTALRALVMNAVEASGDSPVHIIASNQERYCKGRESESAFIKIEIHDAGDGVSPELGAKVFDPFFTTKEGHLGLGLTSAWSIIDRHDSSIELHHGKTGGTVVTVLLPSYTARSPVSVSGLSSHKKGSAGVRILVMDDEPGIREILQIILSREGFQVDAVSCGEDAVSAVAKAYEKLNPYQVVILDLIIPGGMGGKDAIQKIRAISPSVLAIVSSGYSDDPISSRFLEYGFDASLPKPYHPKDMIALLFLLLDNLYQK